MSSSDPRDNFAETLGPVLPDYTLPITRTGEQQFGAIVRNRSGVDAGNIYFGARDITHLSDVDQQDAVSAAFALYEAFCDQANKCAPRDTAKRHE